MQVHKPHRESFPRTSWGCGHVRLGTPAPLREIFSPLELEGVLQNAKVDFR